MKSNVFCVLPPSNSHINPKSMPWNFTFFPPELPWNRPKIRQKIQQNPADPLAARCRSRLVPNAGPTIWASRAPTPGTTSVEEAMRMPSDWPSGRGLWIVIYTYTYILSHTTSTYCCCYSYSFQLFYIYCCIYIYICACTSLYIYIYIDMHTTIIFCIGLLSMQVSIWSLGHTDDQSSIL